MSYATAKLSLVTSTIEGQGPQFWTTINSDSIATMLGASYITDALKLGMRVGDIVFLSSGTFATAPYTAPTTAAVGDVADYTDTPPVRAIVQVGSFSSNAATLTDKLQIGGTATGLVGFYGATPVVQRANAIQATSLVSAYTATTASALIGALLVEIANTLNGLGIWKGAA